MIPDGKEESPMLDFWINSDGSKTEIREHEKSAYIRTKIENKYTAAELHNFNGK